MVKYKITNICINLKIKWIVLKENMLNFQNWSLPNNLRLLDLSGGLLHNGVSCAAVHLFPAM
jgi:hypothetical protein